MGSWPTGIETIGQLIAGGDLQRIEPAPDAAAASLESAQMHLESALVIAKSDADGAYSLLYDAARKSLVAVQQVQGLRATSRGGHYAIQQAIGAQFTKPPPSIAFRSFGRLRRTRNQIEYDDISSVTTEDVKADVEAVRAIHAMATQLIGRLPLFTD